MNLFSFHSTFKCNKFQSAWFMACLLFVLVLIVFFVSSYIEKTTTRRRHHDRVESFSEQYTSTTIHEEYSLPTNNHHQEQVQALNEHQVNNTTKATPSASHEKNESTLNFNHGTNSHTNQPPSMIVSTSSLRHNRSFTNEFNSSHNHDTKPFKTKTTPFSTMKWRQDQSLKYDHNKEKELNTHSNTHSSKFTLNSRQEFKKHLFGDFQCNRYGMRHGVGSPNLVPYSYSNIYLPPETLMASCKFENLCLTSEGEFVLFHSSDRLTTEEFYLNQFLNEFPWVYVQGSTVESNRGNFYVRVVDGDLVVNYHKSNVNKRSKIESMYMKSKALNCNARTNSSRGSSTTCRDLGLFSSMDFQNETLTPISISQNFTFYKKPVYALKRYAAGNFGHVLSETLGMIMGLMQNFPHDRMVEDNHILYLDDVFDTSGTNWMASFRYDPHLATKLSIEGAQLLSKNSILQLCYQAGEWKVMKAPCPNKEGHSLPSIRKVIRYSVEKPLMLQSCFSQFYAGHTITNFVLYPYGKESHFLKIRELAFRNLKILPYDTKHRTKKEKRQRMKHFMSTNDIVIAIHRKGASSRHGQALANVDELARYFQTHLSNHSFIQQLLNSSNSNNHHSQQQMHRKLKIQVIELHQFKTIASQIEYFSQVDIYISDPGSAAYYAIFMRDETMMILPPTCHSETKQCRISHGTFVLSALPNVQVVEMMEMLLKGVSPECVPKALPMNPNNCEVIMPPPLLANAIVRALRRRFRKFVNNV